MAKKKKNPNQKMLDNLDKKFADEFNEQQRFGNERIIQVNIADADLEYSQVFGANKNLYRTIPSLQDGLRPVARRHLFSWWELEKRPQKTDKATLNKLKFIKVDKLTANTVNYHPHGTTSIDELNGRMGQYWNNNVQYIVPQGSYGNSAGDRAAAGRYREAKLSEYAIDCFFEDFDKYCVPMKLGYDGENYEPEFLPAKYPNILFNPQLSGIGYGLASNIPPFNVAEVLDATIKLIKNPKEKILLIPDSPTGCDVVDNGLFEDVNKTGSAKLVLRAKTEIDYLNNVIIITALPLNASSSGVINKLIEYRATDKKGKTFGKIIEIKDYTKEGDVRIEIFLKKDAKPEKVLKAFYEKNTGLKSTEPVGITVIDDYQEYEYGVKDLLLEWISYREDVVRSMFLNNMQILINKQHMNEVLLMVFDKDNIDTTIKIAKESNSRSETIDKYIKTYGITSLQAGVIADMHVYNFNKDSYNRYKEESVKIKDELSEVMNTLEHDELIDEFIIKQLEEGKKKYGRPRKSKVVKEDNSYDDNIPDIDYLVGINEAGFIKKLPLKGNTSIGQVGKSNANLVVYEVNNREDLLVVDSVGNVVKVSISAIPEANSALDDIGVELKRFFSVQGGIKGVMELPSMEILKIKDENFAITFVTKKGFAKKVQLSEFKKITDKKPGITLNDDDEVATAIITTDTEDKDIVLSTNLGNAIRLKFSEIRSAASTAKGVNMITLKDGEEIVNASVINPKKKLMFLMTTSGRAKVIESKYFPVMKRKEESINLINLVGTESLLGVSSVNKTDIVMCFHKVGEPETLEIKNIDIGTRVSKGARLIKTGRGDSIVAYKIFTK